MNLIQAWKERQYGRKEKSLAAPVASTKYWMDRLVFSQQFFLLLMLLKLIITTSSSLSVDQSGGTITRWPCEAAPGSTTAVLATDGEARCDCIGPVWNLLLASSNQERELHVRTNEVAGL